jgi:hypothetical protein
MVLQYKVWYNGMPVFASSDYFECISVCKENNYDYVELLGRVIYPSPNTKKNINE